MKIVYPIFVIILIIISLYFLKTDKPNPSLVQPELVSQKPISQNARPSPKTPNPTPLPESKILSNNYHVFQTFNNCGPAALSMALSYYGINKTQTELGEQLRPYQVPGGNNDDKSVTLEEVAKKSKEFNLIPYLRPNGNDEIIKKFIAIDIPVITRTWLKENDDIGHYRIIKGYDDKTKEFIQDDSLQGKNLRYSYDQFNKIWDKFNYEYLVLVPKEKQYLAEQIIGEDLNEEIAWQKAAELSKQKLKENPNDYTAGFNLSVAYYKLGEYQKSAEDFEKVENLLPFRTLWYQIEPIYSYYYLGNDTKVLELSDKILNNQNQAFSELYILKGKVYERQGKKDLAKIEYEKAVTYNKYLKEARDALEAL